MRPTILVVDDTADMVELLSHNLEHDGYHVLSAFNGADALSLAAEHLPALIILDLMLPDFDGFTVCETLRKQTATRHIPILLLTAVVGEIPRLHGIESGATDFCTKPIRLAELRARIKRALQKQSAPHGEPAGR